MSVNNITLSGLTIAEPPAVSGVDIITHELTAPTNPTIAEQDLIKDSILAALEDLTNRVIVIFMPNKMKTEALDRCVNVGVTAAGGKILAAPNNLLTILKGEKTLVVHFIASCSFAHQPEIVVPPEDESVIGYQGGENSGEDSGDETTLGGDGGEETTLEPPTPSGADEVESSFESYSGQGFTQEMW